MPDGLLGASNEESKADKKKREKAEKAAQRGQKAAIITEADPTDPLKDCYGDFKLVQSTEITGKNWTSVRELSEDLKGQTVLLRGRIHAVRGKGKSCFLVLRQRTATVQVQWYKKT